ncbi:MAG TPA: ferrous iron transport protein A [Actinobacteria bacterium]|nr:ferrous iron transport protein A [Actinomycetota bacterium]
MASITSPSGGLLPLRAPMSPDLIQPLTTCRIRSLSEENGTSSRLAQMGILPGVKMQIVRTGPFGGAVEVALDHGDLVALRSEEIEGMDCDIIAMPLTSVAVTKGTYRIVSLAGRNGFRRRMEELGLTEDARIEVLATSPAVLVRVAGEPVRLGRGEADKIVVEEASDGRP